MKKVIIGIVIGVFLYSPFVRANNLDKDDIVINDSCYVKSKDKWYLLKAEFNVPNSGNLWNAISQHLFHKETPSADSAYFKYVHSFAEMRNMKKFTQTEERRIELSSKCVSQVKGRYMNIIVKYHKQWNEKKYLNEIVKERNFIYNAENDKVLTAQDIFSETKANDIEAYAADSLAYYMHANNKRVLLIYTKKDKYGNPIGLPKNTETLYYAYNNADFRNDFLNLMGFNGYENQMDDVQKKVIYKKESSRISIQTSMNNKVELDERDIDGQSNGNEVQYQIPTFNGGSNGIASYIADNFKYPDEGWAKQAFGRVEVTFDVEPIGSISNVQLLRSIDDCVDNEVLRVIREMPNWTPGRQNGYSFIVKCTLNIYIIPSYK